MRVEEYERHFTKMMRYAANDTNTKEKKQFWFLYGLHPCKDHYSSPSDTPTMMMARR
ncbi:uncharacterized protein C2845_PM16G05430 [Panicum miliaceum]|uniref:Uncharacterized protein n=1 Tax=Panicum miliaceum TaxID=4540 RepID=A0A3L6Q025_PANMI|nr:uncharacterized protein C2845_PM16G05430 [Panicum miliaceum]